MRKHYLLFVTLGALFFEEEPFLVVEMERPYASETALLTADLETVVSLFAVFRTTLPILQNYKLSWK
jgi:hypothetical protein